MVDSIDGINQSKESALNAQLERLASLNNINQQRQNLTVNEASTQNNNGGSGQSAPKDTVSITPAATFISSSGLDKNQSEVRRTSEGVDFNLKFSSGQFNTITAKGSFSAGKKQMNLFLNFDFQDKIKVEGSEENRTFNARLKVQANNVRPDVFSRLASNSVKIEKQVDSFMGKMLERALQKQFPPTSVILNLNDIADLVSESGGIFQRVSRAMMLLNRTLARAIEGNTITPEDSPRVDLVLGSGNGEEETGNTIEIKDFSFHLRDVTPIIGSQGGAGPSVGNSGGETPPPPPPTVGGGTDTTL